MLALRITLLLVATLPLFGQEAWRSDWVSFRDALETCFTNSKSCIQNATANFPGDVNWAGTYLGAGNCPLSFDVNGVTLPCFRVQMPRTDSFTAYGDSYLLSIVLSVTPTNVAEWQSLSAGNPVRLHANSVAILAGPGLVPSLAVAVFEAALSPPPQISGVVNGASFARGIAANSWITIQGASFSVPTATWDGAIMNGALPTALRGITVNVGGKPAYVAFVSPAQINAVAPDMGPGPVPVTVASYGVVSSEFSVNAQAVQPAFFLWAGKYPVATRLDYSLAVKDGTFANIATSAAKPGENIILWGTGFGATNPAAPAGMQTPADRIYPTAGTVTLTIGDVPALVFGAALAPGFAGLYQVAVQIPANAPDGDLPVIATINGSQSLPNAVITVQK